MDRFEEFGKRIDEEIARLKRINNFEDFGRRVDEAAGWIEARQAARNAQNAQNPRNPSSS